MCVWRGRTVALPTPLPRSRVHKAPEHSRMPSTKQSSRWNGSYKAVRATSLFPRWVRDLLSSGSRSPCSPRSCTEPIPERMFPSFPGNGEAIMPSVVPYVSLRKFAVCHHELLINSNRKSQERNQYNCDEFHRTSKHF